MEREIDDYEGNTSVEKRWDNSRRAAELVHRCGDYRKEDRV